ncbi:MAG TPA: hypothetical protein VF759_17280 [Allosphingosinicella sp.]
MRLDRIRAVLAALLVPLAAACAVNTTVPKTLYSPCRALGSSDWTARLQIFASASPKPYLRRKLVVTGSVTTPGGVYASLDPGPVSRLDEAVQQVFVRTEGTPEPGAAPAVHRVRGVFPALKAYGGVAIRCGDGVIAEIREVATPPRED